MLFPLDRTVSRPPLSALLDGNQHLPCLSQRPSNVAHLVIGTSVLQRAGLNTPRSSFNSCLPSAPKPCHILPSLSYLILSLLFPGVHPPYHISPSLLTCFHVHFPVLFHSDLPQIPQISKHYLPLCSETPICPPPYAYRIEVQLLTSSLIALSEHGPIISLCSPSSCPPYTHVYNSNQGGTFVPGVLLEHPLPFHSIHHS